MSINSKNGIKRISIDEKCTIPIRPSFGEEKVKSFRRSKSKLVYAKNGHNISFSGGLVGKLEEKSSSNFINRRDIDFANQEF